MRVRVGIVAVAAVIGLVGCGGGSSAGTVVPPTASEVTSATDGSPSGDSGLGALAETSPPAPSGAPSGASSDPSGSGAGTGATGKAAAPRGRTMTQAEATGALLRLSDLPAGWKSVPTSPPSTSRTDPTACLTLINLLVKSGYAARADARFAAEAGVPQFQEAIASYRTAAAAKLKPLPALLKKCPKFTQTAGSEKYTYKATALTVGKAGDRTFAFRLSTTAGKTPVVADIVYVAVGNNLVRFNMIASKPVPRTELDRLVGTGVDRLGT